MVKINISDIQSILRYFNIPVSVASANKIKNKKYSTTNSHNTVVSFEILSARYTLFFDEFANDDKKYIINELSETITGTNLQLVSNPEDPNSYSYIYKGKAVYLLAIDNQSCRLDVLLTKLYPNYTRTQIKKCIHSGYVRLEDKVVKQPSLIVLNDSQVSISIPEGQTVQKVDIPIIYIDDDVIVIDKPAGILSHSKGRANDEYTVADFFKDYTSYNIDTNRPGIVHRLDRDTSGVMIGARNPESAHYLQKQFAKRSVKKDYYAVLSKIPKIDKAIIDIPIGRDPNSPSTFRVDSKGKNAVTFYQVVKTVGNECLVYLKPSTGRTHQLRVHMRHLNAPIKGDRIYGKKDKRLYLHASSLEITLPSRKREVFKSPLPREFKSYE